MLGGSVHGLGASLLEEFFHDEDGQPLNANFTAYAMPSAAEVPEIRTAFVESPSPAEPARRQGHRRGRRRSASRPRSATRSRTQ